MSRPHGPREVPTLTRDLAELPARAVTPADRARTADRIAGLQHDLSAAMLSDAPGTSGQAFAVEDAHTAGVLTPDLRGDTQPKAPEAASLPDGTPHADPRLAARGWQVRNGVYVRRPAASRETEAG